MKKSTSQSTRALIALLLCGATCFAVAGTLLGLRPEPATNVSQRSLTFAERVAYQRAIEDVYWRHRIWPKERPDAKPSLDAVMSQAQLERKAADYLRKSQALEDYWQRPITAEQLQAEMDRMAKHTKQPEVLHELFEALGNDPFAIAECLARPALADRLLTNWYAYDQRIHGELKQRAEAELQAHPSVEQMKQLSGSYSETEFIKNNKGQDPKNRGAESSMRLNSRVRDETVEKLAATFGVRRQFAAFKSADISADCKNAAAEAYETIPTGKPSALREDETRYYATAVIEKTQNRLKLATILWVKEPLESWLARADNQVPAELAVPIRGYALPKISGGGCVDDTWTATAVAPSGRGAHTAVWTGSEMIIWGGYPDLNTGGRYNPSTDMWTVTSTTNAPDGRYNHTAVWTGTEMIIWGGSGNAPPALNSGGRYNPGADSWTATSMANAPSGRSAHTAVWTGSEMIVWGGASGDDYFSTGGKYNPTTDSWAPTTITNTPDARIIHTAVWTGGEMIVWGGMGEFIGNLDTGGRYNPGSDTWINTSTVNAPEGRFGHTAVWTGNMIIWGGYDGANFLDTGGKYDVVTNSWTAMSTSNAPSGRSDHTAVWSGNEMIVWGGADGLFSVTNTGGRYNPNTDSWVATSTVNAPDAREAHTAVWTGTEVIIWGGGDVSSDFGSGGRYCAQSGPPPSPTPTPTPCTGRCAPTPRPRPTPAPRP